MDSRFITILKKIGELADDFSIAPEHLLVEDLGVDSLKLIDTVLLLESQFSMELSEDKLVSTRTVGELWDAVLAATASS
jgi:acyl carrier protein